MMIKVTNYKPSDVLSYSLPLLKGEVTTISEGEILIKNITKNSKFVCWPIITGKFKALVELLPGENTILLQHNNREVQLQLNYKPLNFQKFVRLVYIICCDDDGLFQAAPGEDNSVESACDRISLGAQMLQTFTAEKLKEHGLNPKTFCLEEENGRPICHVFNSSLCLKDALKLPQEELWSHFATELMTSNLRVGNNCKFLGFLSFTRYQNNSREEPKTFKDIVSWTRGYVALGGGGLALFGTACLHTWSRRLDEVPWKFGDSRKIDRMQLMDDSGNRGSYWACYATGLGATLHELGHTFDLGHTTKGIMARGFDDIHKFFIIDMFYCSQLFQKKYNPHYRKILHKEEHDVHISKFSTTSWSPHSIHEPLHDKNLDHIPQSNRSTNKKSSKVLPPKSVTGLHSLKTVKLQNPPWRIPNPPENFIGDPNNPVAVGGAFWCRSSALILYYHKWFNDYEENSENSISVNGTKVSSPHGIRMVEFRDEEGTAFYHQEFISGDGEIETDLVLLDVGRHLRQSSAEVKVHVQDSLGNICQHVMCSELLL